LRKALRSERIAAREALPAAERQALTGRIETHLDALVARLAPGCLAFCWPWRGEVDLLPWARRWLAADPARRAALPVVLTPARPMEFLRWRPDAPMATDHHGIPIPAGDEPVSPELLIVPSTSSTPRATGWATAAAISTAPWPPSTRPHLRGGGLRAGPLRLHPPQPHDKPMDWVVTEAGVFGGVGSREWGRAGGRCAGDFRLDGLFGFP
jgi:5-formyltetrahydrofolate cyclo-ligase